MANKKLLVSRVIEWSGLGLLARQLRQPNLIIYNFHRIRSEEILNSQFDENVFGITAGQLERLLKTLLTYAEPIGEEEIYNHITHRRPLTRRSFAVTFDDGYSDFYEVVWPLLRSLNIKPILFISTEAVTSRKLWWWDQIAYIVKHSPLRTWTWEGRKFHLPEESGKLILSLQRSYKTDVDFGNSKSMITLATQLGVTLFAEKNDSDQILTWDQIRILISEGVTVGAHSHRHDIFSKMTLEDQRQDLEQCLSILMQQLGVRPKSLAWPVGGYPHFTSGSVEIAKSLGFEMIYSFETGANSLNSVNPYNIKRVNGNNHPVVACAEMAFPEIFQQYKSLPTIGEH